MKFNNKLNSTCRVFSISPVEQHVFCFWLITAITIRFWLVPIIVGLSNFNGDYSTCSCYLKLDKEHATAKKNRETKQFNSEAEYPKRDKPLTGYFNLCKIIDKTVGRTLAKKLKKKT